MSASAPPMTPKCAPVYNSESLAQNNKNKEFFLPDGFCNLRFKFEVTALQPQGGAA